MKKTVAFTAALLGLVVIVLPALVIGLVGHWQDWLGAPLVKTPSQSIRVYLAAEKRVVTLDLEEYLQGVLAAEMPAEFEGEALKAQAVAARTYAVRNLVAYGGKGAPDCAEADVSTDIRYGQAWLDDKSCQARWGDKYRQYRDKIAQAVAATRQEVVTYQGRCVQAVFHSTCGQKTASAAEVWGTDVPYLQSVECPWDREAPRYQEEKRLSFNELTQKLGAEATSLPAQTGGGLAAQILKRTASGRVDTVRVGSKNWSGVELRDKLGLRSAAFTVKQEPQGLVFQTTGYGHGVGLCQYGANGMAKAGRSYRDILTYYYQGVQIQSLSSLPANG